MMRAAIRRAAETLAPPAAIARRARQGYRKAKEAGKRVYYTSRLKRILAQNTDIDEVVIFLPSLVWRVSLFQRPHQLAQAFARQGCLTFFCERHTSLTYPPGFHRIHERLYIANVPFEAFRILAAPIVVALVYNNEDIPYFDHARIVYEYIDELDVFEGELGDLQRKHNWFIQHADLVVATADKLYQQVLASRPDALLAPNGVDYEFIRTTIQSTNQPPDELRGLVESGRPIIGYYGALAKWFDYRLLASVANQRPGYHFVLIGPDYDGSILESDLNELSNVHWLGVKPYRELPRYLKYFDVATIPFILNKITHSTSPLKLFEYMSGSKPVVTTAMRECTRYPEVIIADGPSDFSHKLDQALDLRYDEQYQERLRHRATENTWGLRVKSILRALNSTDSESMVGASE
jgi:glycosyltransferase involved in cell wall biosynthesis